mgnify:CR=1 FL=1
MKVDADHASWQWDRKYVKNGSVYKADHTDGRCSVYHHDGPLKLRDGIKAFQRLDGSLHPDRRRDPELWPDEKYYHEPGEWVETSMLATTKQEGFAGHDFWITLDTGEKAVLRGPWHGGSPDGYEEVSYWSSQMKHFAKPNSKYWRPWWERGGVGGLFLSQQVWVDIVSTYQAHLELAEVKRYARTNKIYIEQLKPEWSAPKGLGTKQHGLGGV